MCANKETFHPYLIQHEVITTYDGICDACKIGYMSLQEDASYKKDKKSGGVPTYIVGKMYPTEIFQFFRIIIKK